MRGVGGADCLQLSLLLLDLFCIQRIVTNTHAARSNEEHTHTHAQAYACVHALSLTRLRLFLFVYYLLLVTENQEKKTTTFFSTAIWLQLTHLIHGRFGQIQADGAAQRSRDAIGKLLVCSGSSSSWTTAAAATTR